MNDTLEAEIAPFKTRAEAEAFAERRAEFWIDQGILAKNRGDKAEANSCFDQSRYWFARGNNLRAAS